jgi:DNA modification methylase
VTWKNRIVGYDTKPANQFTANPLNFRRHPVPQREALRGLLGEVGWVGAVLENVTTGNLIDGHARIEEALSKDEETPIPYLKVELSESEEKLVLASFDPISAMATSDKETLDLLLKEVSTGDAAVRSMLAELAKDNGLYVDNEPKDAEPQIDRAEELRQKWGTETGQLWVIGDHRLLVGDSTKKADVGRLCANNKPLLMVTDPPYGVDYDPTWRDDKGTFGIGKVTMRGKVENDDNASWSEAYQLSPADVAYIWHASRHCITVNQNLLDAGYEVRAQIIWRKQHFAMSRGDYHWQHEPLFYAVRKSKKSGWLGDRTQSTIWDINNANPSGHTADLEVKLGHGTQKPLECMARPIRNHSGDVYDPFIGSGTTMVAAENLKRKCYAMEISAAYCAVTLERMATAFPHLKIEKVEQARAA